MVNHKPTSSRFGNRKQLFKNRPALVEDALQYLHNALPLDGGDVPRRRQGAFHACGQAQDPYHRRWCYRQGGCDGPVGAPLAQNILPVYLKMW